jgi:Flp pilus assembly protein CpaB
VVGATAGLVALLIVLVYLNRYRDSLQAANDSIPVLVAKVGIQKGSPGDAVAAAGQYRVQYFPKAQVAGLALVDPSALRGTIATHDVYPDQQLTAADFAPSVAGSVQGSLTGNARAIAVSLDAAHGLLGQVGAGDHVDVYVGLQVRGLTGTIPVIKLLAPNVLVLGAPGAGGNGNILLRARGNIAAKLAFASDNGTLWLVLRPANNAAAVNPGLINSSALLGLKPVR